MLKENRHNARVLYFTDKLMERIENLIDFPCTVIEAPMGYGKTTAVREAMRIINAKVLWQNVYDSGVFEFWIGFCQAFSELDKGLSDRLRQMGMPVNSMLKREMINFMQSVLLENHTFLIIDDYHFVNAVEVDKFLAFFLKNLPEKLHVIVITRLTFLKDIAELKLKGIINHIGTETLEFSKCDIAKYYSLCGVNTTEEEQELLYALSEGWISALYLLMLEYKMRGSFDKIIDIHDLVRETVYLPLSDELKCFLNCICIFDVFSLEQAKYMWAKGNEEGLLDKLISQNNFIKKDRLTGNYQLHNIFTFCIREEFSKENEEIQRKVWKRAGEWYAKKGEYISAMDCFYKIGDFHRLLFAFENDKNLNCNDEYNKKIMNYISKCPEKIRSKHHLAMLIYARKLFILNENELFIRACNEFLRNLKEDKNIDKDAKNALMGEYELVISFVEYNDIVKMSEHHQKAYELLKRPSKIFDKTLNWTFGAPSILYLFYRESGKLSQQLELMKETIPYYYKLTDGHGMGAEYVMEAEIHFFRGDFENAEICLYKAIEKAQSKQQWSILLCAEFLKVRIALNEGDYTEVNSLLISMRKNLNLQSNYTLLYTMDICEAYVYILIGQLQKVAKWILQGDFLNTKLMFPVIPTLHMIYGRILLEQKEYLKLIGLSEMFLKTAGVLPNLICQVYIHIYLAVAYEKIYNRDKAIEQLKKALDIAMQDDLYMPFIENGKYIVDMIREGKIQREYRVFSRFHKLYYNYNIAINFICKEHFAEVISLRLTEREEEVAELVAQGLSNKEIAQQLYIAEDTVKSRLKIIFKKLSIKSRAQLEEYIYKKNRKC